MLFGQPESETRHFSLAIPSFFQLFASSDWDAIFRLSSLTRSSGISSELRGAIWDLSRAKQPLRLPEAAKKAAKKIKK
jgi:hypothetical protein